MSGPITPTIRRRLRRCLAWLVASFALIIGACFAVNCAVDPLWYLDGNIVTHINYPFDERAEKINRFLPRRADYDCLIFGTSRATLLPVTNIKQYHCYNMAFSDAQGSELVLYGKYLLAAGIHPKAIIVDIKREDFVGPAKAPQVPDFIRDLGAPPSIFVSYLSLDTLDFSIRTLRGDSPHHRYYDADFAAELEVRSKRHNYKPSSAIGLPEGPVDVHPERAEPYLALRALFPDARAVAYIPPESAWRVASFSMIDGFGDYLGAMDRIAGAYDRLLDFAIPSELTESTEGTYDGSHYARAVNARVAPALFGADPSPAVDWHGRDVPAMATAYKDRIADFVATLSRANDAGR